MPRAPTRLSPSVTWLYAAGWLVLMLDGHGSSLRKDPLLWLGDPPHLGARLADRDVEIAASDVPLLPGPIDRLLLPTEAEAIDAALDIHSDLERWAGDVSNSLAITGRLRRALLHAEAGEWDEALLVLEARPDLQAALGVLYPELGAPPIGARVFRSPEAVADRGRAVIGLAEAALAWNSQGWLSRRVRARLLRIAGDGAEADAVRSRLETRSRDLRWRAEAVWLLQAVAAGAGLVIAGAAALRAWASPVGAGAPREGLAPAWSLADGLGVWIRADFWSAAVYATWARLPAAAADGSWSQAFPHGVPLLAALPLVYLCARHLWPGEGHDPWGLAPEATRWPRLGAIALAALCVDELGALALQWLCWSAGFEVHWAEGTDESLIFGTIWQVVGTSLDYLAWTPAVEELAFRGVLYLSLRRRLSAPAAALTSSFLFAGLHFYALPGFLVTLWSGLVWAGAFERARSLWPAFLAHGAYNGFYVLHVLALYR